MFWVNNQYSHSPQIETILAKEDLTLTELFNQEGLLQELKSPNKNLIDFITRSDMLTELVRLVTEEPSADRDIKERYKFANLACEVLTTDTPLINEKLSERTHLTRLYSFLDSEPPLNPLLASFFARTFSMLICRKHDQHWYSYQFTCLHVLDFLKSQDSSLSKLVLHMGTSAIMELTLKLLTQIEGPEMQNTLVNLVEQGNLIEKLIDLLHPSLDEDRNHNVSSLLVDTIYKAKDDINTNAADSMNKRRDSHTILAKIQSEAMVKRLLENVFGSEVTESSIVGGVSVLLALICPPPVPAVGRRDICDDSTNGAGGGDPAKTARSQASVMPILSAITPYLFVIHGLLLHPPKRDPIKLTCGTLDPPLGQARLSLVRLLAVLISTDFSEINEELDRLNTFSLLLDLFFEYRWNNFLHSQVAKCLNLDFSKAFEQTESTEPSAPADPNLSLVNPLVRSVFIKCHILDRIVTAAEANSEEQSNGLRRRGYMGHLMVIASSLLKAMQDNEVLGRWVEEHVKEDEWSAWSTWVQGVLVPTIAESSRCLGGAHPMYQVHCSGVSEPADDINVLEKITLIKFKDDDSQISDGVVKRLYDASNQTEFSIVFPRPGNDGLPKSTRSSDSHFHDNSLDAAANSSDDEDKDDDNDVWSNCFNIEADGDPWGPSKGVLNTDDSWADFESASPVTYAGVLQHGSAAAVRTAARAVRIASILDRSDDQLDEDEEPPQLFEVSPEPGEEGDDGSCEPPPLPSSPPPPLPASPPPLPSAVPEAPPLLAAQGDSRSPRPLAPPSDPPPPPPIHRVEAVREQVSVPEPPSQQQPVSGTESEKLPDALVVIGADVIGAHSSPDEIPEIPQAAVPPALVTETASIVPNVTTAAQVSISTPLPATTTIASFVEPIPSTVSAQMIISTSITESCPASSESVCCQNESVPSTEVPPATPTESSQDIASVPLSENPSQPLAGGASVSGNETAP